MKSYKVLTAALLGLSVSLTSVSAVADGYRHKSGYDKDWFDIDIQDISVTKGNLSPIVNGKKNNISSQSSAGALQSNISKIVNISPIKASVVKYAPSLDSLAMKAPMYELNNNVSNALNISTQGQQNFNTNNDNFGYGDTHNHSYAP